MDFSIECNTVNSVFKVRTHHVDHVDLLSPSYVNCDEYTPHHHVQHAASMMNTLHTRTPHHHVSMLT